MAPLTLLYPLQPTVAQLKIPYIRYLWVIKNTYTPVMYIQ